MNRSRRRLLSAAVATAAGTAIAMVGARALGQGGETVVRIRTKKFEYLPSEITLKVGVPVVFELTAEDITMGFNLPDFKLRTDVVPDKVVRLPFTPDRIGTFEYYCDVFCGDGHEDMSGKMRVVA
jgi:cytochrome c oxidase subunit 2